MRGDCWGTWLIMLGFMDLGWPRVCRRSTAVLLCLLSASFVTVWLLWLTPFCLLFEFAPPTEKKYSWFRKNVNDHGCTICSEGWVGVHWALQSSESKLILSLLAILFVLEVVWAMRLWFVQVSSVTKNLSTLWNMACKYVSLMQNWELYFSYWPQHVDSIKTCRYLKD